MRLLPRLPLLKISALLKFLQISAYKMSQPNHLSLKPLKVEYLSNHWCGQIPQRTEDAPRNDRLKGVKLHFTGLKSSQK